MRHILICQIILLASLVYRARAVDAPIGLVSRTGDQSIVLHWDNSTDADVSGYKVYRALTNGGPFAVLNPAALVTSAGYCDTSAKVINGHTNYYYVTAVAKTSQESQRSTVIAAVPHGFADDDEFLEYLQQVSFDYFWYLANPRNGLIPDRTSRGSACSIAAVGFGLSAIAVGIDHGWITRTQGVARVLTTLKTFWQAPQGSNPRGTIGYKGWFYHFLDMNTATRAGAELSSMDTVLLLAGILDAKQFFNGTSADETAIRTMADAIFDRVDWTWMTRGMNVVSMGWFPDSGFIRNDWIGYNEAMILCCLGLGAQTNALPATAWEAWTSGYTWTQSYGLSFVPFPPLFGHQYSHCWIDFRFTVDPYMRGHNSSYFENSRRATLAQRSYCIANPLHHAGYNGTVWGLTASDGPPGYSAHGAPPAQEDDGTIAPTAAGGSIAFTPEYSVPTLRYFYQLYRPNIWTAYGFRDAFNLGAHWVAQDELGIDQGPIVIMIENYRTQRVWRRFMQNEIVQRGLQRAGFVPLEFAMQSPRLHPTGNALSAGSTTPLEDSSSLSTWFELPISDSGSLESQRCLSDVEAPPTVADQIGIGSSSHSGSGLGGPLAKP